MNKQELIEKWEKEMDETLEWIKNEKDDCNKMVFISRETAISDVLEDVKKLNEAIVSEEKECATCKYVLPDDKCSHTHGCDGDYELWEHS